MGGMSDHALLILGTLFLIGGLMNIVLAEDYVCYVTSLYTVRTVRVMGWVCIVFALLLIVASFWI